MTDQNVDLEAAGEGEPKEGDAAVSTEPPAYSSVFKRVRSARQQSTSKVGFAKALPAILIGSVGCTICIGLTLALPISMIVMGAIYLDECPVQRMIPIYLVVGGTFSLFVNLMSLLESICQQKNPDRPRSGLSNLLNACEGFIGCFMLIWFIIGNVWIYSTFGKFTTTPGDDTFCNPTLYWYAFWITTAGYIILGVLIISICVIMCCALCCASLCKTSS